MFLTFRFPLQNYYIGFPSTSCFFQKHEKIPLSIAIWRWDFGEKFSSYFVLSLRFTGLSPGVDIFSVTFPACRVGRSIAIAKPR